MPETDALEGQEIPLLNAMLVSIQQTARAGDLDAIDRVCKILTLRRQYQADRDERTHEWKGAKR